MSASPSPSTLRLSLPRCVHVDAAHVRHRQIVAYKKCIAWDEGQLHAQSNRIDGNFFSFAKVLRRMCHMDRSRNSMEQQQRQQPCPVHKCRLRLRLALHAGDIFVRLPRRTTTSEFSVFCAFLKWANLCDTLRQLIKLNKHEAGMGTGMGTYIERKLRIVEMQSGTKPGGKFHFHFEEFVNYKLNVKLVIYF